jgi:DNA repair protein RadD
MTLALRPYQIEAKTQIYEAWRTGAQNVLLQLYTGAGKTVLFSDIIREHRGRSVAIAHRMELVSQISLTLARYGVRHNIIAQKPTIRACVAIHMLELNTSYYDPNAACSVAGVDTLIKLDPTRNPWFQDVTLLVQDEGHHPLKENKWGKAAALFPNARGLYPTATPIRADGNGLGRHADGIMDVLIEGPPMRELIDAGYLCDYRDNDKIYIYHPQSRLDTIEVPLTASGDFSPTKLREAVHEAKITGDVVEHYLKLASGKLGVTFAVDIKAATDIALAFRTAGVAAEVISSKTPDVLRADIMRRFRKREILQLVNVDLLGEGVDVPAIEVVSMARPTQSYALYNQQFGRALRPLEGKTHAIIIDHAGNVMRHDLPDRPRTWSLDRRERRRSGATDAIPLKNCLNILCLAVYERYRKTCPQCGKYIPPADRSAPEHVDGDLLELDLEMLALLHGRIAEIDGPPRVPHHVDAIVAKSIIIKHTLKQRAQMGLRHLIAVYAGYYRDVGAEDSEIYKRFYLAFGLDVMTAQILRTREAEALAERIRGFLTLKGVEI